MRPHHTISVILEVLGDAALIAFVIASQVYWIRRLRNLGKRWIRSRAGRRALAVVALAFCVVVLIYNFSPLWEAGSKSSTRLTPGAALLGAPFQWWIFGSVFGFLIVFLFSAVYGAARLIGWLARRSWHRDPFALLRAGSAGSSGSRRSQEPRLEARTTKPGPASPARRR